MEREFYSKSTSPKNLATKGNISGLVIQALKSIEKGKIKGDEKQKIIGNLNHDIKVAPEWFIIIMREA